MDESKEYKEQCQTEDIIDAVNAERKARQKILFEVYYNDYKERIAQGADPQTYIEELFFNRVRTKVKGTRNIAITGYWWFTFTIDKSRFTDGDYLERLKKKVNKFITKKVVKRAIWCYELTKEEMPHVHMLIEVDNENPVAKHTFDKGVVNTFKDVGHVKTKKCPEEWVKDKVQYLLGNKWDEEKEDMITKDREWRQSVDLQPYYEIGGWGDYLDAPHPVRKQF